MIRRPQDCHEGNGEISSEMRSGLSELLLNLTRLIADGRGRGFHHARHHLQLEGYIGTGD